MNRLAVLFGASQGMGFAVARRMGREGFHLVIASRNPEPAASRLEQEGYRVRTLTADIGDPATPGRLLTLLGETPRVDALLLNHGGPPVRPFQEVDDTLWHTWFETMVVGPLRVLRALIPLLEQARPGRVVAITSFTVRNPLPGMALSNALRAALTNALFTAAREHPHVLINTVAPGFIQTERLAAFQEAQARLQGKDVDVLRQELADRTALKRIGTPEEIAEVVTFLLSRNTYITGREIPVDGGLGGF